jgi:hypothetical protein
MKRLLAALALLLSGLGAARAGALVDLTVTDLDTGATLPVYNDRGRYTVPGTPGHRYSVRLSNRVGERVLAVLSVDGVNAISGQTASPHQSGYVLGPWQSTEVRGWRKNMTQVAEFYFTDLPDSYAARTGRPQNVGVIGVAVFRERLPEPPVAIEEREWSGYPDAAKRAVPSSEAGRALGGARDSAASAPAPYPRARQELGTGHGQRRYDPARYAQFQRASSQPDEVISLFYDDFDALVARGVVPPPCCQHHDRAPDPFPVGFVPDPRW